LLGSFSGESSPLLSLDPRQLWR